MRKTLPEQPKILVLTLYSGENEFNSCVDSLNKQTYKNWDHVIFENLPNVEAHEKLYSEIMAKKDEYDLFIKLDADMVFKRSVCLEEIISLFKTYPDMDHAETVVHDWYSDTMIWGMHIFTANVRWDKGQDKIFVDHKPKIPGIKKYFRNHGAPFVDHSPNPSDFHAYTFGVHRALKAAQRGYTKKNYSQCDFQWELMQNVWKHYYKTKEKRLGYVLLGFEDGLTKRVDRLIDNSYKGKLLKNYFMDKYAFKKTEQILKVLKIKWANDHIRKIRMFLFKKLWFAIR